MFVETFHSLLNQKHVFCQDYSICLNSFRQFYNDAKFMFCLASREVDYATQVELQVSLELFVFYYAYQERPNDCHYYSVCLVHAYLHSADHVHMNACRHPWVM